MRLEAQAGQLGRSGAAPFVGERASRGPASGVVAGRAHVIDQRFGEPTACRWFLNWFDETPREEMREQLLAEVQRALAQRRAVEDDAEVGSESETAAA